MGLTVVTAPTEEPVTVAEAKSHLRADSAADDALIGSLIGAAREYCQDWQGRFYITQTWALTLDEFPSGVIEIPRPPLISVDSVVYVASDGTSTTLDAAEWDYDAASLPGRLFPAYDKAWPGTRAVPAAVTVTFTAGYGAAAAVPDAVKQAMLLLVGDWYANREAQVVGTVTQRLGFSVHALLGQNALVNF